MTQGKLSRRRFLGLAAAGAATLATGPALGIGALSEVRLARLRYAGAAASRQSALFVLAQELRMRTSIDVSLEVADVGLMDPELFHFPFLVMIGDRDYGRLPQKQADRLKVWLEAGGTLFVDNIGAAGPSDGFDGAFREEVERIFPRAPLGRIPPEHVVYRAFYRVDYPAGRLIARPYLEGITLDRRLAVVYSQNDLAGAWARDSFGNWEYDVVPGGENQRQMALRLGINMVEYTLCQDYKDDQVHLDYLLRKRNWKIKVPQPNP